MFLHIFADGRVVVFQPSADSGTTKSLSISGTPGLGRIFMQKALDYLSGFIDTCADCKIGRKGNCEWFSQYRSAAAEQQPIKTTTAEQRLVMLYGLAGEPCDKQQSFDVFVARLDGFLADAGNPSTYPALVAFLSELARVESRRKRFPKALLPLLPDLLTTGREHCLAHIDFAFLNRGIDLEPLLLDFFPEYQRSDVLENCCYPPSLVQRLIKHAVKMNMDEIEGGLKVFIPVMGIGEDSQHKTDLAILSEKEQSVVLPYLATLVNKGYCRGDYTWRNTTEEGGHSNTQAAWIIRQIWLATGQSFAQYKLGKVMGINSIHSYGQRVKEVEPYKESIRKLFRTAGLKF